jgi:hypothetical protein
MEYITVGSIKKHSNKIYHTVKSSMARTIIINKNTTQLLLISIPITKLTDHRLIITIKILRIRS